MGSKLGPAGIKLRNVALADGGSGTFSTEAHRVVDLLTASWFVHLNDLDMARFTVAGHRGNPLTLAHTT